MKTQVPKLDNYLKILHLRGSFYILITLGILFSSTSILSAQGVNTYNRFSVSNEEISVQHYTKDQGLPGEVSKIIQDEQGFLWFITSKGLSRFDGYDFKAYQKKGRGRPGIDSDNIGSAVINQKGEILIRTASGLSKLGPKTEQFSKLNLDIPNSGDFAGTLFKDQSRQIWIAASTGLYKYEEPSEQLIHYPLEHPELSLLKEAYDTSFSINEIFQGPDGVIILDYSNYGMYVFNPKDATFIKIEGVSEQTWITRTSFGVKDGATFFWTNKGVYTYSKPGVVELTSFDYNLLDITPSGKYIISKDNTIYILGSDKDTLQQITVDKEVYDQLDCPCKSKFIATVFEDRSGGIWIGLRDFGLLHVFETKNKIKSYPYLTNPDSCDHVLRAPVKLNDDFLLVNGCDVFDLQNERFITIDDSGFDIPSSYSSIRLRDADGYLWVEDKLKDSIVVYQLSAYDDKKYDFAFGYQLSKLKEDSTSTLLVGAGKHKVWFSIANPGRDTLSLLLLKDKDKFYKEPIITHQLKVRRGDNITGVHQTAEGLWANSLTGLYRLPSEEQYFQRVARRNMSHPAALKIFEDSKGVLWFATVEGLTRYDPSSQKYSQYYHGDGLAGRLITDIIELDNGHILLATFEGYITVFDPNQDIFQFNNYDVGQGIIDNIMFGTLFDQTDNTYYIRHKNALTIIPSTPINSGTPPPLYITAIKKYSAGNGKSLETAIRDIDTLKQLEFSYNDNIITFETVLLNYSNAKENEYKYQLEGFSKDWVPNGKKREITFTNLSPGTYTLRVKANGLLGSEETMTSLKFRVRPHWSQTTVAYTIYTLLLLGLVYSIYQFLKRRWILQNELRKEQESALRLQELDTFKTRLYTNLTHEFRTPLAVILGMTDQIEAAPKKNLQEGLKMIRRNGKQLLQLINQLLDLSKLENNALKLHLQQGDIIPYLRYIVESFESYANTRNVSLQFQSSIHLLVMDYDPEQIQQIMMNLISNAIKFTPSEGAIVMSVAEQYRNLVIKVKDTGIGIPEKDLPNIFDRFYQVDSSSTRKGEGTGIGLAHTKELVKLMGGEISVSSQEHKGTTFTVRLPIVRDDTTPAFEEDYKHQADAETIVIPAQHLSTDTASTPSKPTADLPQILIVEDNPDVVSYLKSCLEDRYQVNIAYNGAAGIEKALETIPDIIISDVMMPEKDGYEVCDTLKNDERTSHIPIILLTAKVDAQSRLSGLKTGADAYLAKPFDKTELLVRLEMMVKKQKQVLAYFTRKFQTKIFLGTTDKTPSSENPKEDAFMDKVRQIVADYHGDEDFGLPQLCQKLAMSRSQLFRKLKALINMAPSDYIRNYRMQRAKYLLENTDTNVAEAAYEVGFKDPSYFSKIFQETFGVLPGSILM